jgi:hypothetical protein
VEEPDSREGELFSAALIATERLHLLIRTGQQRERPDLHSMHSLEGVMPVREQPPNVMWPL